MTRRININDQIQEPFYQLPKVMIWNKKFRNGLSSDAKLLYMLLKDRFQLSLTKQGSAGAFRDRNGDVYCILDNFEIAFLLNTSVKSVIKYIQELVQMGLVEYRETEGGAHKYYLLALESDDVDLGQFLGERDYHKHVLQQKKKGKPVRKTEEQCIEEQRKRTTGEKMNPPLESREEETAFLGVETVQPWGEPMTAPGEKSFHPNENDFKNPKKNQSNLKLIQSSSVPATEMTYIEDKPITTEEEEKVNRMLTYLGQQLLAKKVIRTTKQVNRILQLLMLNGHIYFDEVDVANSIFHYETQCLKRGKIYSPVEFFVNGFEMVLDQRHSLGIKSKMRAPQKSEWIADEVPFYNWLEQDCDVPELSTKRGMSCEEEHEYLEWRKSLSFGA